MDQFLVYLALVLFGACFGSFAGATVWRIRAKQLAYEKEHKEPYDRKEYARLKKLLGKKATNDRSQCLECGYTLKWYDLIPVISWLTLKGKCRNCKHPIGRFELLIELGMIAFFVLSFAFWPGGVETGFDIARFALWLAAGVAMGILFAYDSKWFLLPDSAVITLGVIGLGMAGVTMLETQNVWGTALNVLGAVGILGGLYWVLHAVSGGRWVGFGDVKLGAALGLLLGDWKLAAVGLFLANFIGCLVVLPLLLTKKLQPGSHIPFGPLLIAGAVVSWFIGAGILGWYLGIIGI